MNLFWVVMFVAIFARPQSVEAQSATGTGTATMTVIAPLGITAVSNLVFPQAAPGAAAATVAPGTVENANNASFNVTGQASTAYTIQLPAAAITMTTGAGGAGRTISVSTFVSSPAAGANGLLSGTGTQSLFVGATRAALPTTQIAGAYTGTFTVTVLY